MKYKIKELLYQIVVNYNFNLVPEQLKLSKKPRNLN